MSDSLPTYYARSDPNHLPPDVPGANWQRLAAHLTGVQRRARAQATAIAGGNARFIEAAAWTGLLHDLGKYTDAFQRRLRAMAAGETAERVEHSGHGAAIALQVGAVDAAFAIAGHHAGLPALKGSASSLVERAKRLRLESGIALDRARRDFPNEGREFPAGQPPTTEGKPNDPGAELSVRILGSLLVDADRLDAGGREDPARTLHDAQGRLDRLLEWISVRASSVTNPVVKEARKDVLDACLAAAEWEERLLSLTVPTGGGKTLAATAFALRRAILRPTEARRLIYVVPYLSIIEQNAGVLAAAIGEDAILEHHSGELLSESGRRGEGAPAFEGLERDAWLGRENWNSPVVVTTSERFFETLFSNYPSELRRLQAVAGATVVLDEVQTLPRGMLGPILAMLQELAKHWKTTVVFCTATQPAFERTGGDHDGRLAPGTIREIAPPALRLAERLARVEAAWPGKGGLPERPSWDDVAGAMGAEKRVLCIVNLTRHARTLYERLVARTGVGEAWHLSARMCPAHRLEVLGKIKVALSSGGPCRVVATQVVEAGVDLDFPVVFRAMAPLDSIVQAAGRCDREGRLTQAAGHPAGRLIVFEPELGGGIDGPPGVYREATGITRRLVAGAEVTVDDAQAMRRYFSDLYACGREGLDAEDIAGHRARFDFPTVAEKFRIIPDDSAALVIEWGDEVRAVLREVGSFNRLFPRHYRPLQRASISLHRMEFEKLKWEGLISEFVRDSDLWIAPTGSYRDDVGFVGRIDLPLIA